MCSFSAFRHSKRFLFNLFLLPIVILQIDNIWVERVWRLIWFFLLYLFFFRHSLPKSVTVVFSGEIFTAEHFWQRNSDDNLQATFCFNLWHNFSTKVFIGFWYFNKELVCRSNWNNRNRFSVATLFDYRLINRKGRGNLCGKLREITKSY